MSETNPSDRLERLSRAFGTEPADAKARLLADLIGRRRLSLRDLHKLHATLCFMRAYPDDARLRQLVERAVARLREWTGELRGGGDVAALANSGVPDSCTTHEYSHAVLPALARVAPGCLTIDWDAMEDTGPLQRALGLVVAPGECQGLDDIYTSMEEWVRRARPSASITDLEFVLALFAGSPLTDEVSAFAYEACEVPVRYRLSRPGTGLAEIIWPAARVHYQKSDIPRDRQPLSAQLGQPFDGEQRLSPAQGTALVGLALRALCARSLEIFGLTYANPRDARILACGRGVEIALVGVLPEARDTLESTYFFLVMKNGVPVAYGPASPCLGCCEMGINMFPEFRGGEIRFVLPQLMRVLHQVLGVRYFYLTSYGMGEGNPDAIRSGAFWFYRKLGFRVTNPKVEALARAEEEKMRADPSHRSGTRMLHRLSVTDAYYDLSGGECRRLDLGALGLQISRLIAEQFDGRRPEAEEQCAQRVAVELGIENAADWPADRRRALRILAPVFCVLPGFRDWRGGERALARQLTRAKGGASEVGFDRLLWRHRALREGLWHLATRHSEDDVPAG